MTEELFIRNTILRFRYLLEHKEELDFICIGALTYVLITCLSNYKLIDKILLDIDYRDWYKTNKGSLLFPLDNSRRPRD